MDLTSIKEAVIFGKFKEIEDLVGSVLNQGVSPQFILDEALVPGMDEVGIRFSSGEIFIPEMMVAGKVMHMALALLKPYFIGKKPKTLGKFAIGTVKDDLHDIGKNIVISMMEGTGFEVVDLGVDCPPEGFIQAIEEKGLRDKVRILVGGAAVTTGVAEKVGADAYAEDAGEGVIKAKALLR